MKLLKILSIVLIGIVSGSACGKDQSDKTNASPATNNAEVTFIELGSVNCVPCRMMQPVMDQIKKDYAGVVKVVFYDVWTPEQRSKIQEFRIRAIPTQVFLDEDGKEFFRHVGYFPVEEIEKILAQKGVRKKGSGDKKDEKK